MSSLASLLLQAAISLLLLVQANPNLNASLRQQAITIAKQAIQVATRQSTSSTNAPPSIAVLSPNGGEQWAIGSQHTIRWSAEGSRLPATVMLTYSPSVSASTERYIADVPTSAGSYTWTIPDTEIGPYYVTVALGDGGPDRYDKSDTSFSITEATPLFVKLKATDSIIESYILNARAQAELFYDRGNSYAGVCADGRYGILQFVTDADTANGAGRADCNSTATAYAVEAQLVSSTDYYCVDSIGQAKTIASPGKAPTAMSCP